MDLTFYLLEHLKKHGRTEISGFGVFSLANTGAAISNGQSILPPAKEITFAPDREIRNRDFIRDLAREQHISEFDAELELKKFTNRYNSKIDAGENFEIEKIGAFQFEEGNLIFKGMRISGPEPDFYGLEEIRLSEIHSASPETRPAEATESGSDYRFRKSILLIFLVAVPVAGIIFLGIRYPEMIFGKKSRLTVNNSTHRIEKKPAADSVRQKAVADTLVSDSVRRPSPASLQSK